MPPTPNAEIQALLSDLNAAFGKKPKQPKRPPTDNEIARERNTAFHQANPLRGKPAMGIARPDPEDSTAWKPIQRVVHLVRQKCNTCANTVEFIGGEYVRFKSIHAFGGYITRRTENCPDLFLYESIDTPLEEVIEEHYQSVSRCAGCIAVERQAEEIWNTFLESQRKELAAAGKIDIDLDKPIQRSLEEAFGGGSQ